MDIGPIGNALQPGLAAADRSAAGSGTPVAAGRIAAAPAYTADVVQTTAAAEPVGAAQIVAQGTQNAQSAATQPSQAKVEKAIEEINKAMKSLSQDGLEFSVDKDTNFSVVKIIDKQTNQVIRQLPSQATIEIAKALDKLQGLLIKQEA